MNPIIASVRRVKTILSRVPVLPALVVAVCFALTAPAFGINASPQPITFTQPDGTRVTIRPKGDEFTHWFEDMNGFAVVPSGASLVYAQRRADGSLGATALRVGRDNPRAAGLTPGLRPSPQFIRGERQRFKSSSATAGQSITTAGAAATTSPPRRIRAVGTVKNLVILCKFADHTLGVHTRPPEDYNVLMNTNGGSPTLAPSGSLKDYYREASYGTVTIESTVIAWVTLPQTEDYYTAGADGLGFYPRNAQRMVEDALNAANSIVNFGEFDTDNDGYIDAIDIIHSGYGAEWGRPQGDWIWSHKWDLSGIPGEVWNSGDRNANGVTVKVFDYHTEPALWATSGTEMTRVGVIAHETGHFFGLPDLYDTDNSSEGAGSYCLMANSWGFDNSQLHPPHMSAWAKIQLGWVTPTAIVPGTYNAPRVETSPTVYKITNGFPGAEYLLIENRQPFGFESDMPQGGLAIWHIDDTVFDVNDDEGYPAGVDWLASFGWPSSHYQVGLLEADGFFQLERGLNRGDGGDVYRGGGIAVVSGVSSPSTESYQTGILIPTANVITNISVSASNMTFTYINPNAVPAAPVQVVPVEASLLTENYTPTNRAMDPGELVTVSYRLRNLGVTNADVTATLLASGGVLAPSAPKIFSLPNTGVAKSNTYSFIASGQCGTSVTNTLQLQYAGTNLGSVSFIFPLGAPIARLREGFDTAKPPALATNWTRTPVVGGWVTENLIFNSPTNAAFISDPPTISDASLTSPQFLIGSTNAVLTFSHRYDLEYGFDGGVLEVSLDNGPFIDILASGARFDRNGYNFFVDDSFGNPLAGRDAWTGSSTNFVTTTVLFPPTVAGKTARLRWRFASDSAVGATGWYVDSILLTEFGCSYSPQSPSIVNTRHSGTNVVFSFTGRTGVYYAIEYKNALNDPVWTPLAVQPATGVLQSITNNIGAAQRFYRLRSL
jgi:M6 family metalloprotease-like protein